MLKTKEVKKTEFCDMAGLSRSTLAKMGKEEYVALEVIEWICNALECDINDVIKMTSESSGF